MKAATTSEDAMLTIETLAAQLTQQGLKIEPADLDGMLGMARDLTLSARTMRVKRAYSLEALNGFSLAKTAEGIK